MWTWRPLAARRRAVLVVPKGERPQPGRSLRCGGCLHDPADDNAVGKVIEVIVAPFAGRAGGGSALEDEIVLVQIYRA
jgi:hypothetical protein